MTSHIRIPRPYITTGPSGDVHADAVHYLVEAAERVRHGRIWGSGVSALVARVLDDVVTAMEMKPGADGAPLLTPEEHEVMDMTANLANALRRVVGDGPHAAHDWNEIAAPIHTIQHHVLAQAAARAYPERYRLMGQTLTTVAETPPDPEAIRRYWTEGPGSEPIDFPEQQS